jgi:hypothetical protein
MRILAIVSGEYGLRHVRNLEAHMPADWRLESWSAPAALPLIMDYPEEFLPESMNPCDLVLSFAENRSVAELIPEIVKLTGAQAVIAAIDNEAWLPRGLGLRDTQAAVLADRTRLQGHAPRARELRQRPDQRLRAPLRAAGYPPERGRGDPHHHRCGCAARRGLRLRARRGGEAGRPIRRRGRGGGRAGAPPLPLPGEHGQAERLQPRHAHARVRPPAAGEPGRATKALQTKPLHRPRRA